VVRLLADGHAAVARLVDGSPFLAALAGRDRAAAGAPDPEGARSQLSFDLAEVIVAAAAQRPVLVIIDDAHQADPSSLRLLAELAPALRSMPAVVLVTARDGDQDWRGRLDERSALLRSGLVITLPPFGEDDVAGGAPGRGPAAADTGEVIDAQARAAYRDRLRELEEAAAEADAAADTGRSARIAAERDALVEALTQAYGLGGRFRRAGSDAERARTAVTARVKDAIRRIGEAHPDLGRHLARSVRTGTFCVYDPDQPTRWSR
jgi:hypothetical protein